MYYYKLNSTGNDLKEWVVPSQEMSKNKSRNQGWLNKYPTVFLYWNIMQP